MSILHAFFYGIIQGLTEFLPVSSSGHLALLPHFLSIKDPGVFFDLTMHIGTALAVGLYYRSALGHLITHAYPYSLNFLKRRQAEGKEERLFRHLGLSTLLTILFILLFKGWAEQYGRDPQVMAFNFIFFGVLMGLADYGSKKKKLLNENAFSAVMGLTQALAIFPGVSRSGVTLTTALGLGRTRDEAASYSFLMSFPIILIGFAAKLPAAIKEGNFQLLPSLIGVITSFIVGFLSIHFCLKVLKRLGTLPFVAYKILVGLFILFYL